ncbi:MAG: hypothetical protein HKN29_13635 [Rhodothermales bacterium]|nr:hypothetical protein [Rhodothermales bacterium]
MTQSKGQRDEKRLRGRVRISAAALDKVVLAAVQEAPGVHDVHGLVLGSVIGTATGALVGFVEAGPAGAAIGAAAGAAVGAAAAEFVEGRRARQEMFDLASDNPVVSVRVSASYQQDLEKLAAVVRERVRTRVERTLGVKLAQVDIEIVDVAL